MKNNDEKMGEETIFLCLGSRQSRTSPTVLIIRCLSMTLLPRARVGGTMLASDSHTASMHLRNQAMHQDG